MKYFVYRNHTVEPFFVGKDFTFSGYDDISSIPSDVEGYIWCYQVPIKYNLRVLSDEVQSYIAKMRFITERIVSSKQILLFTLCDFCSVPLTGDDIRLTQAIAEYNAAIEELSNTYANVRRIDFY